MAEPLDVKVLEAVEAIRRRPLMYVGSTGRDGLHALVACAVGCAAEEAYAGFVREIDVTLRADGGVRVRDDGRGIPVGPFRDEGRSTLEAVLTTLFTGCRHEPGALAASGQPQGMGAVVVNALSTRLDAEVGRDGHRWTMSFAAARPLTPLTRHEAVERTWTALTFRADPAIFETTVDDGLRRGRAAARARRPLRRLRRVDHRARRAPARRRRPRPRRHARTLKITTRERGVRAAKLRRSRPARKGHAPDVAPPLRRRSRP